MTTEIPINVYGDCLVTELDPDARLSEDRSRPIGTHGTEQQCGGIITMARISTSYRVLECNACNLRVHVPVLGSTTVASLANLVERRNYRKSGSSGMRRDRGVLQPKPTDEE